MAFLRWHDAVRRARPSPQARSEALCHEKVQRYPSSQCHRDRAVAKARSRRHRRSVLVHRSQVRGCASCVLHVGIKRKKNRVHIYNNMHRRRSKSKSPKTKQKRYRGPEDPVVKQYMEHAMPLLRDWINFPMSYTHIPYSQAVPAVYAAPTAPEPMYRPLHEMYDDPQPQLITPAQPEVFEHYAPPSHVTLSLIHI